MTKSREWLRLPAIVILVKLLISSAYASDILEPPGRLVSVSDKQLHIRCLGTGSPVVILESGLGGSSLDWAKVQPMLASVTRVCSYDRAGYGWSEGDALPRTSARIAHELHDLLHNADEQGPFLLVGHSFGGFAVRLFASLYPQETNALVLLDASHEDQFLALKKSAIRKVSRTRVISGNRKPIIPDNLPSVIKSLAMQLAEKPEAATALMSEMRYFQNSANQVRHSALAADIPVKIITRGKQEWPDNDAGNRLESTWRSLQEDLYDRLSSSSTGLSHQFANDSGHYIHLDEPRLVIRAIRKMVLSQRRLALLETASSNN